MRSTAWQWLLMTAKAATPMAKMRASLLDAGGHPGMAVLEALAVMAA